MTSTQSMSTQRQWVSATVLPDGRVLGTGGSAVENQLTWREQRRRDLEPADRAVDRRAPPGPTRASITRAPCCCPMPACSSSAAARPARWSTSTPRSTTRRICSTRRGARAARPSDRLGAGYRCPGRPSSGGHGQRQRRQPRHVHQDRLDDAQREHGSALTSSCRSPPTARCSTCRCRRARGDVPPGYYMLFVLDGQGVPSVARMVRVGHHRVRPPTAGLHASRRRRGRRTVHARLRCQRSARRRARHDGDLREPGGPAVRARGPDRPVDRLAGRRAASPARRARPAYSKTCPANSAISGFRGALRAST